MIGSKFAHGVAVPTLAFACLAGAPAIAQQAEGVSEQTASEDEILVTARRVAENIQETPVSVVALTPEALERTNFTELGDITRVVPAVRFTGLNNPVLGVIEMRGIGNAATGNSGPGVQLYMNDVPGGNFGANNPAFDIASIQVLRGPQGTLFGRNTIGGAVLVGTQAPSYKLNGYAKGQLGNHSLYSIEGALNIPLIGEHVAIRVGGQIRRRDGTTKLVGAAPFDDQGDIHTDAFRASLLVEPFEGLKNTLIFDYFKDDSHGVASVGLADLAASGGDPDEVNVYGFPYLGTNRKKVVIINTTEIKLGGDTKLKNIYGYQKADDNYGIFLNIAPVGPFQKVGASASDYSETITDEVQLLGSAFDSKVDWLIGGFYYKKRPTGDNQFLQYIYAAGNAPYAVQGSSTYVADESKAGFANFTVRLAERLKLNAGVRYSWDEQNVCAVGFFAPGAPTPSALAVSESSCIANAALDQPGSGIVESRSEALTWNVGLDFKVNEDLFFYLASRRGYRSGGAASNIYNTPCTTGAIVAGGSADPTPATVDAGECTAPGGGVNSGTSYGPTPGRAIDLRPYQVLQPEKLTDVELGMRSDWHLGGWHQRLNLTAYRYVYDNVIIVNSIGGISNPTGPLTPNDPASPIGGALPLNGGQVKTKGVEAELVLEPSRLFTLSGSLAYTDSRVSRLNVLIAGALTGSAVNLPTPKWSGTGALRYQLPFQLAGGALNINYDFFFTTAFRAQNVPIDGYNVSNLRFEWAGIGGQPVTAAFWMRNVFDQRFRVGPAFPAAGIFIIAEPRLVGLDLTFRFH